MKTQNVLNLRRFSPKKKFSQNFLLKTEISQDIVSQLSLSEDSCVLEIGAGPGTLTQYILQKNIKHCVVVEIDQQFVSGLSNMIRTSSVDTVLLNKNILNIQLSNLVTNSQCNKFHIIGNLPYNISSKILLHLIQQFSYVHEMVFCLQKEVVDRICSKHNSRLYGRLSIIMQSLFKIEKLFDIDGNQFFPKTEVQSSVFKMTPYQYFDSNFLNYLSLITNIMFKSRRKKIKRSLELLRDKFNLNSLYMDENLRAENIAVEEYINLTRHVIDKVK